MAECIREETSEREDSIIGGRSDRRCLTEAAKPCVVRGHSTELREVDLGSCLRSSMDLLSDLE